MVTIAVRHSFSESLATLRGMVFSNHLAFLILMLSVVVVPLCADHNTYDIYTAPKEAAVELLGLALFVFFTMGLTGKSVVRICISPLGLPLGIFMTLGLLTLLYATNIWAGFDRLFFLLTCLMFFLGAINLVKTKSALMKIIPVVLGTAFIISVIGILQFYHKLAPVAALNGLLAAIGIPQLVPGLDTYNRETYCSMFGHANFAGQYLVTVVPLALSIAAWGLSQWRRRRLVPLLGIVSAAVAVIYLGITFCRGAWVGTIAAIAMMLFFSPRRKLFLTVAVVALALFGALSPLIKDDKGESMAHKFLSIFDVKDKPTQFRFLVWKSSLRVVREEPLGAGVGNFRVIYPKHRTVEERRNTGWDKVIYKAHNDYVQTFVELGVLGFAAYLWFILVILKMARRMTRGCDDSFLRAVWLGLFGGIVGMFVHSTFSSNFQLPGSAHSFFVVLGLFASVYGMITGSSGPCLRTKVIDAFGKVAGGQHHDDRKSAAMGVILVRFLLMGILLMGVTIPLRALLANYHFGKGQYYEGLSHDAKNAQEWKRNIDLSLKHLRSAVWESPRNYEIRYFSSVVENMAGNYAIAEVDGRMAVELAPYFDHIVNSYGNVLYNEKKFAEAMIQFKRALELNPVYEDAMLRLGNTYREMGDYQSALKYYAKAQKTCPEDAMPLFNKALVFQDIGERLMRHGGDVKKARKLLMDAKTIYEHCLKIKQENIKVLNNLGTVNYSLGNPTAARKYFEKAISIIPEHVSARMNLAAVCEQQHDWDCAIEQYEALLRISGGKSKEFAQALRRVQAKKVKAAP